MLKKVITFIFIFFINTNNSFGQNKIVKATITFTFVEKGVTGTISGFKSKSIINWEMPEKSIISGTVDAATLKTGNFLRDWSLKGSSYFNVNNFPTISFKSTEVTMSGASIQVKGILTIKGIAKPIELSLSRKGSRLLGDTTLYSSDFDITILKKGKEANKVTVQFDFLLE